MRKKAQEEARLKSAYGGKPNEKQSPKAHQEDQRKKCKGKWSAVECKSATEYKSAAEYRSAAKYSSSAEWLQQIKANWTQDPFDPVNIIWPTKTQILLYKRICVKTNMKKHGEMKKGTVGSVSSRSYVKERKSKPNEMTNIVGNAWKNKIETYDRTKQGYSATIKIAWEQKKTKKEDNEASIQGSEHHQLVPSQYKGGGSTVKGIQWVWFGGGGKRGSIFGFQPWLFSGMYHIGMVSYPRKIVDGWDHLMHVIKVGGEIAQSLSIWT